LLNIIIAVIKERNIACTNIAVLNRGFSAEEMVLFTTHLKYFCFSKSKRRKMGDISVT